MLNMTMNNIREKKNTSKLVYLTCKQESQCSHLNQVHFGLDAVRVEDVVAFDAVDDAIGDAIGTDELLLVSVAAFIRTPRLAANVRFIRLIELLLSAFRWSSNAVRKKVIVVNWCLSCEQSVCIWLLIECFSKQHMHVKSEFDLSNNNTLDYETGSMQLKGGLRRRL